MSEAEQQTFLESVFIAAPCNVSWDVMKGTETVRNCTDCSRKVFNLSDMTRSEAEEFLRVNGASQCVSFYRRKDGTIMTDDCPIGLRKVRNAARRMRNVAAVMLGTLVSTVAAFAQAADFSENVEVQETTTQINRSLWRKPLPAGVLHQLGVPAVGNYKPTAFEVPAYSELRSGRYALGKELIERQGRMFVLIDQLRVLSKASSREEILEPVPTVLTFGHSDLTAKILEAQGDYPAAEAFHKIYIKTLEADSKDAGSFRQQIASDYRDFLFRQKRVEEARRVENDFSLEPEDDSAGSSAFEPISKKVRINLPLYR